MIAFALASKDYAEKRSLLLAKGESGRARSSSNSNSSFSSLWTPMTNSAAAAYSPAGLQPSALPSAPPAPPQGDPFEDPHSASIEVDFADSSAHYYVKVRAGLPPQLPACRCTLRRTSGRCARS